MEYTSRKPLSSTSRSRSALHNDPSPIRAKAIRKRTSQPQYSQAHINHNTYSPAHSSRSEHDSDATSTLSSSSSERGGNFKVVIRIRPPLPRELNSDRPFQNVIQVDSSGHLLTVTENPVPTGLDPNSTAMYGSQVFSFDHVYDQHCTQKTVYENTAKAVVESSLEGYNATIFAYGQTGTGKTYTMEGFNAAGLVEERGIIPRAIEQIFQHISSNVSARTRFLVRASYLQIYNETISDLLKPERNNLTIREDKKRGVFVEGLSEWVVRSPEEIYGLMERGGAMRATGSTRMNEMSSRSHAVFIIIAEQSRTSYVDKQGNELSPEEFTSLVNAYQSRLGSNKSGNHAQGRLQRGHPSIESMIRQSFKVGKLNLVDLAGSERVRLSGATGQRLEESKKINQSLSALGNVIAALTDFRGRQHIPYRDSKLTRILEDSLGGNCKTTMMAMISPAQEAMIESLSTLKFANRAKNIKNEARVNEDLDQKSLLRKYERELKRLRAELEEKSRNVVDKRRLLELEEQRRRAEEDKMAAIRALEERSREFMKEKEEKKKLEERIAMLMSQMLMSSHHEMLQYGNNEEANNAKVLFAADVEDPIVRDAIKEHKERIRKEYDCRLADLEKERETIEEEKAQVDRYKQLLLKQRDIMIALTQRLNERDEQITTLQDELDAYDHHQKELEEKLDEKTAHLIHFERIAMERGTSQSSPEKNMEPECAIAEVDHTERLDHLVAEETEKLSLRIARLEEENDALQQSNESQANYTQERVSGLVDQCETLLKERRAVQTIMEQKIKALTNAIGEASAATLQTGGGVKQLGEPAKWLLREVNALQRLVNASIIALRNAERSTKPALKEENDSQRKVASVSAVESSY
uniref:Kinesin-like protein n=1 Tax=Albugo laibachii Nc14 TaxID=890382 RepID=F0W2E5_9STRA|nr:kinesinlike protein putative [Albugo laibachii Nc14]|eukprot:CCA15231.1 kinesinlike protein putative [Albugo laibachii Nc14]